MEYDLGMKKDVLTDSYAEDIFLALVDGHTEAATELYNDAPRFVVDYLACSLLPEWRAKFGFKP